MRRVYPCNPLAAAIGIQAAAGGFLQEVGITFRKLGRVTDKPGDFILPHQKQGERKLQFPAVRATRRSDFGCVPQTEQKVQKGSDACLCLTARILPFLPHPDVDIGPVEQSNQQPGQQEKTGKADDETVPMSLMNTFSVG